MPRYLIEVSYKGTRYGGFQIQQNANTIQAEVERSLQIFFRRPFELTGSSRTDAGVHALQNFFHFDSSDPFTKDELINVTYHLNAILPDDVVVQSLMAVADDFHCRFDAISREYHYYVYRKKDPFMQDRGYYFPYRIDTNLMQEAAAEVMRHDYFESFSKKHHQAKTFICRMISSNWEERDNVLIYKVEASRFLRGMVRGLVGTMLRVGTGKLSPADFVAIIKAGDQSRVDFSAPPQGLFLTGVKYPEPSK